MKRPLCFQRAHGDCPQWRRPVHMCNASANARIICINLYSIYRRRSHVRAYAADCKRCSIATDDGRKRVETTSAIGRAYSGGMLLQQQHKRVRYTERCERACSQTHAGDGTRLAHFSIAIHIQCLYILYIHKHTHTCARGRCMLMRALDAKICSHMWVRVFQ